jgi:hypothetical protein
MWARPRAQMCAQHEAQRKPGRYVALGGTMTDACKAVFGVVMLASCSHRQPVSSRAGGLPVQTRLEVRQISVSIDRPPQDVYSFASNIENLPKWATGLGKTIRNVDGEWIADSPTCQVKVRFVRRNDFGVLDHDVILESGTTIHNAIRVVLNGRGSEVIFTLFRQPSVSEEKFAEDAKWVEKDLRMLKSLLER